MNDEARLRQRRREYVADGPGQGVTFESVVATGRRRRVAGPPVPPSAPGRRGQLPDGGCARRGQPRGVRDGRTRRDRPSGAERVADADGRGEAARRASGAGHELPGSAADRRGTTLDCDDYRWGGQTCHTVDVADGVVLVTKSGHVDYDQGRGQQDMEVVLVRDDGTGMRLTQYNFDPDDTGSPGTAFPLTESEAVSLVQDPTLDYRG